MITASRVTAPKVLVGDQGVWIFILADLVLFLCFFTLYSAERLSDVPAFRESQALLSSATGAINTLLLLTSSWLVALGVHRARDRKSGRLSIATAIALGVLFVGVKITEYVHVIDDGASMTDNGFFMYYFVITGMHLVHVLIGLVVLVLVFGKAESVSRKDRVFMESGAAYWHMVDLLWLFIFPLLYLLT